MNPDQKHAHDVFWCLSELKKEQLFAESTNRPDELTFCVRKPTDGVPPYTDQGKILRYLQTQGVIEIIGNLREFEYDNHNSHVVQESDMEYDIRILDGFENLYAKYKSEELNHSSSPDTNLATPKDVTIRLKLRKNILSIESGTESFVIKKQRLDQFPVNLLAYLLLHKPNELVTAGALEADGITGLNNNSLSDIIRNAGIRGEIAQYFLKVSKKESLLLLDETTIPSAAWSAIKLQLHTL
jgi:hypothetical protein